MWASCERFEQKLEAAILVSAGARHDFAPPPVVREKPVSRIRRKLRPFNYTLPDPIRTLILSLILLL